MGVISRVFTNVFNWLSYNCLHYIEFYMAPYKTGKVTDNFYAVQSKNANYFVYINGTAAVCFDAGYKEREGKEEFRKLPVAP